MSKIKIKNFGPIKEGCLDDNGWLNIKKVTVFIGNQGSGKSTVAKLITTFTWMEKAWTRGDYDKEWFTEKDKLKNRFLRYFRLEEYFPKADNTFIDYVGSSCRIVYENGNLEIEDAKNGVYELPQIMYVPAERNFTADVKNPRILKLTSESMIEFVGEFSKALDELKGSLKLPVNEVEVEYNKQFDAVFIKGKVKDEPYKIKLSDASSGFQSLVPLYLVSWRLANLVKGQGENRGELMTSDQRERFRKQIQVITGNNDLTDEQKRIAISEEAKRFNKTAFINIVEEPEQNLFPSSQWQILKSLLEFNNMSEGNKLVMTTHSPYLINYLTLAVKGGELKNQLNNNQKKELNNIVPLSSTINPEELAIYELNEQDGSIKKLEMYDGLPSDENELNDELGETNELFAQLLEIEQKL